MIALGWKRIENHANERIEVLRDMIERAPVDAIVPLQAEIRVWREVMNLPTTLADDRVEPVSAGYNT